MVQIKNINCVPMRTCVLRTKCAPHLQYYYVVIQHIAYFLTAYLRTWVGVRIVRISTHLYKKYAQYAQYAQVRTHTKHHGINI